MTHRLYFGNLDTTFSQQEVEEECKRFGPVASVWVARNPPGFAFVVRFPRILNVSNGAHCQHAAIAGVQ